MPTAATNILQNGHATNVAGYLSDSWKIDRWLLDVGARVEHINLSQETSNLRQGSDGNAVRPVGQRGRIARRYASRTAQATNTRPTFSAGANYEFSDNMSAYVRVNNGVLMQEFRRCPLQRLQRLERLPESVPLQTVQNYEFGFKIQNRWTYIDASVYDKEFQGIAYTPTDINGVPIGPATTLWVDIQRRATRRQRESVRDQ